MSSVPSSSERSGVSPPIASAMCWSIDFFDSTRLNWPFLPRGPVPFRNAALAPMWMPPMSLLPSGAFMPLMVVRYSRHGSSGFIVRLNSKFLPTFSGCQRPG
jgi:hypothetical protein